MEVILANTFQDSLDKLNNEEQKQAKITAMDLQLNPSSPGLQFHKLDRARDPNFCSIRVSRDIRIILHKSGSVLLMCYVDHHDDAYAWAERRKMERHPKTGAQQIVEIRELVREIEVPVYIEKPQQAPEKPLLFTRFTDDELLSYGVPQEWIADVRAANEDSILDIADHLPEEAAEAVLEIATGNTPVAAPVTAESDNPFDHPDAQRRFRAIGDQEELAVALDSPWEKWTTFLHPTQRKLVEREYKGPARVSGSAGTGKTIVALHRAVWLSRNDPAARVLLTTFSDALANALRAKLKLLIGGEPRLAERIEVDSLERVAEKLYATHFEKPSIALSDEIAERISQCATQSTDDAEFSQAFLLGEWNDVIDARQITEWEEYKEAPRIGRKTRLAEAKRKALWEILSRVIESLQSDKKITEKGIYHSLAEHYANQSSGPYDYVIVDEAQDIGISQLQWLAAMGTNKPDTLFFTGDLGQRIFQQAFSWKACGVDIRGRSRSLKINYRTSHQIRQQADKLLDPTVSDVDGNSEERTGTISVFNGPKPLITAYEDERAEIDAVGQWLKNALESGTAPHEIGIFVRSDREIPRASAAVDSAGAQTNMLDSNLKTVNGKVTIGTMHLAKGLEFRAVAVMACDDEVLPLQSRVEAVTDPSDLDDVLNTERHLLYVACTRARDQLMLSSVDPASEFLEDLIV